MSPVFLLRLTGSLKVIPLSSLALKKVSKFPGVVSAHTTKTASPEAPIVGNIESPELLLRLTGRSVNGGLKLAPLSVLFLKNISF